MLQKWDELSLQSAYLQPGLGSAKILKNVEWVQVEYVEWVQGQIQKNKVSNLLLMFDCQLTVK